MRIYIKDTISKVGEKVIINGWVNTRRDHGKLIFLDIRDISGVIQAVALPDQHQAYQEAKNLRSEFVVEVSGTISQRPEKLINPNIETGKIEVQIESLLILNTADTPPFALDQDTKSVNEDLRLKYRYLDLRSERMKKNLILRHQTNQFIRNFLSDHNFYEIETPCLTKSTPEGARDYIVPSRKHQGRFYALPQSPQQYKQLLMVGGLDRYFQIARCFRDEDERGQRQPEFTQIDIEMSFVEQEDILQIIEEMTIKLVQTISPNKQIQSIPFPRITHKEAMEKYNSDKPDLRKDKNNPNLLAFEWVVDFPMFEYKEGDKRWGPAHNPFVAMVPEDIPKLKTNDLKNIRAIQFDLVLNGNEAAGGSIRNHKPEILKQVFQALGHTEKEIESQFGHIMKAFKYGVPPHGGIAFGYDRLIMVLCGEENIREVMAFPKNGEGFDPLMESPSTVSDQQLKELNIKVVS